MAAARAFSQRKFHRNQRQRIWRTQRRRLRADAQAGRSVTTSQKPTVDQRVSRFVKSSDIKCRADWHSGSVCRALSRCSQTGVGT